MKKSKITFPNCKINLGLHILRKRADGFHDIETVFYPVALHDSLEISESTSLSFSSYGIEIPGNANDNLCLKAFRWMQEKYNIPNCRIDLIKHIPLGAGLGGGSADAAAVLLVLNKLFELGLTEDDLIIAASTLGSDCAFFVKNRPVLASGRGEQMQEIELDLSNYFIVLVKPPVHVNTAWAYSQITPNDNRLSVAHQLAKPMALWQQHLMNDFETPIFNSHSEILQVKKQLIEKGAIYACMSGSGSTVFGLFEQRIDLSPFEQSDYFCWQGNMK